MRFLVFVLAFLLVATPVVADTFVPQATGELSARVRFSGSLSSSAPLDLLNFSIYARPPQISSLDVSTAYSLRSDELGNNQLVLTWRNVQSTPYTIEGDVVNRARLDGAKRVPFPYAPPRETWEYLADTTNSQITDEIRERAQELTRGSSNGFEAVTALSTWIYENIEYDSRFGDQIRSADFTYKNRVGVCAGFTNLMVSMTRAVGIPARSVAGIIYSKGGWGYHAWAEVYLDGWVPVDPTWNEVGWIDASHIEVGKFKDGGDVTMLASYISRQRTSVTFTQPSVDVTLKETKSIQQVFETSFESFPAEIGLGDSSVVEVKTRSNAAGCIATATELVSRIDQRGNPAVTVSKPVSLAVCPGEETKSHFILKASEGLERGFVYSKVADIKTFLGDNVPVDTRINPANEERSSLSLTVESTTAKKGDRIRYEVDSGSAYRVYSDLPLDRDEIVAEREGVHYIIAVSATGEIEKRDIEVKKDIAFRITNVRKPSVLECEQAFNVTFNVENLKNTTLDVDVKTTVSEQLTAPGEQSLTLAPSESHQVVIETAVVASCAVGNEFVDVVIDGQRIHVQFALQPGGLTALITAASSFWERIVLVVTTLLGNLLS